MPIDIPRTAISTGNVDKLQCLLRKIGIEDAEFTNPGGTGRIHMYQSNGSKIDNATPLEDTLKRRTAGGGTWSQYTQIIFPCEGVVPIFPPWLGSAAALGNFLDYVNKGGRAFTTHYSYAWLFQNGPLATIGAWTLGGNTVNPLIAQINTGFMRGQDFATWLGLVGALSNPAPPEISIVDSRGDLGSLSPNGGAQLWISASNPASVQHVTIDTPIQTNPDAYCGRIIFSNFHVANSVTNNLIFPTECDMNPLTPQEKVLEFMLFDLAACIGPNKPPPPPPPPPPPAPPPPPPPPPPK